MIFNKICNPSNFINVRLYFKVKNVFNHWIKLASKILVKIFQESNEHVFPDCMQLCFNSNLGNIKQENSTYLFMFITTKHQVLKKMRQSSITLFHMTILKRRGYRSFQQEFQCSLQIIKQSTKRKFQ